MFLARDKYVGAVFDVSGLDATDCEMTMAILGRVRTKPATAGYFARFEQQSGKARRSSDPAVSAVVAAAPAATSGTRGVGATAHSFSISLSS